MSTAIETVRPGIDGVAAARHRIGLHPALLALLLPLAAATLWELAARAGYDPRAAIVLWQKMAKVSNGAPPQWLSTHPSNETRQADLQQYAARVMPFYEEARNARPTQGSKPVK